MNQFTLSEQTLQGHVSNYRLYESIASGGFGSVSIGDDTGTKVPVAIERLARAAEGRAGLHITLCQKRDNLPAHHERRCRLQRTRLQASRGRH